MADDGPNYRTGVTGSPECRVEVSSGLSYALYREDDNGARFLIDRFATRQEADAKAAELGIGGHKQYYFVET